MEKRADLPRKEYPSAWAQATTCHGIIDFYETNHRPLKFAWALLLLVSFGVASWQIVELAKSFLKEPHYTTKSYVEDTDAIQPYKDKWDEWHAQLAEPYKSWNIKQWYINLGFTCPEMLLVCKWADHSFDCCQNGTANPVVTQYGLCWAISPPSWILREYSHDGEQRMKQYIIGSSQGLKLMVHPQLSEYTTDVLYNNYLQQGMAIQLSYDPYQYQMSNPVGLSPGKHFWFSMTKMTKVYKKPDLKLFKIPCVDNATLMHLKGEYTSRKCVTECWLHWMKDSCKCYFLAELIDQSVPICDGMELIKCHADPVLEQRRKEIFEPCMSQCYESCEPRHEVSVSSSMADFGKDFMPKLYSYYSYYGELGNTSLKDFTDTISLNIFFSSTAQTVVETAEKTTAFELMGSVGGQLGLWLGISIVTMVQFFYYAIAACFKFPVGKLENQEN